MVMTRLRKTEGGDFENWQVLQRDTLETKTSVGDDQSGDMITTAASSHRYRGFLLYTQRMLLPFCEVWSRGTLTCYIGREGTIDCRRRPLSQRWFWQSSSNNMPWRTLFFTDAKKQTAGRRHCSRRPNANEHVKTDSIETKPCLVWGIIFS